MIIIFFTVGGLFCEASSDCGNTSDNTRLLLELKAYIIRKRNRNEMKDKNENQSERKKEKNV